MLRKQRFDLSTISKWSATSPVVIFSFVFLEGDIYVLQW